MTETGVHLRVTEDFTNVVPRAVGAISQLQRGFETLSESISGSGGAFEQWQEQLRAVQTAQAINQSTRPISGGGGPQLFDQYGKPINQTQQNNPFMSNGRNIMAQMVEELKEVSESLRDFIGITEKTVDSNVPVPTGGNVPDAQLKPGDGQPGEKRGDKSDFKGWSRDADKIRQFMGGFASGNPIAPLQIAGDAAANKMIEVGATVSGAAKGLFIGGVAAGAAAMGINALTEQYQKASRPAMDNAAMLGFSGGNYWENSNNIHKVMSVASRSAGQYGYSIDEGLAAQKELAQVAGSRYSNADLESTFAYARGFGVDATELSRMQGLGARYGAGNGIGYVAGGLGVAGMAPSQFQEYMRGTLAVFEEGLSKGIVRGFDDISMTQNFLSGVGETWKGDIGARKFSGLNDAVAQGASLSSDIDVIKYRAAMAVNSLAENRAEGWNPNDLISNQMRLEKGFDAQMFKAIGREIQAYAGNDSTAAIQLYGQTYGTSTTDSKALYEYFIRGDFEKAIAQIGTAPSMESPEVKMLREIEGMNQAVRDIGRSFIPAKTEIVATIASVPKEISKIFGLDYDSAINRENLEATRAQRTDRTTDVARVLRGQYDNDSLAYGQIATRYDQTKANAVTVGGNRGEAESADKVMELLSGGGFARQMYLKDKGFNDILGNRNLSWAQIHERGQSILTDAYRNRINMNKAIPVNDPRELSRIIMAADDQGTIQKATGSTVRTNAQIARVIGSRLGGINLNAFNAAMDNGSIAQMLIDDRSARSANSLGGTSVTAVEIENMLNRLISKLPEAMRQQAAIELNVNFTEPPAAAGRP